MRKEPLADFPQPALYFVSQGARVGTIGKKTAKIVAALVCFFLLAGATLYYLGHADEDRRPPPQLIQELAGVGLGMSPTDVTLSRGKPSASSTTETDPGGDAHLTYAY